MTSSGVTFCPGKKIIVRPAGMLRQTNEIYGYGGGGGGEQPLEKADHVRH